MYEVLASIPNPLTVTLRDAAPYQTWGTKVVRGWANQQWFQRRHTDENTHFGLEWELPSPDTGLSVDVIPPCWPSSVAEHPIVQAEGYGLCSSVLAEV